MFIIALSIAIILLSISLFNRGTEQQQQIIGGGRDEHGCLIAAGYSWNETLGFCLREWEITGNEREAIEFSSTLIYKEYGLTVDRLENATCFKCFTIWYDTLGHKRSVGVTPEMNRCPEESRAEDKLCIQVYEPVCAFGDFGNKTFSNSCMACLNGSVEYYFYRECQ